MTNYPTSLDTATELPSPTTGATIPASADANRSEAIIAVETKIGTGASTPTAATALKGTGTGTSSWSAITESDVSDLDHDAVKIQGTAVDSTVGTPSDGDILVYRSAGSDFVLEAKPAAGSNPAAADITDATADGIALITSADANPFTDADESKLDAIEASADVTDATNVTAAGALMDSEVTNLAQVKAFDTTDYATAAQGSTADTALQPTDVASGTITALTGALDLSAGSDGDVLTKQADGSIALETPAAGGGGGNPYGATYVIGSTGDYATLNAYAADTPAANDILYIDGDHTLTADLSLAAYNGIHIIGHRGSTLTLGAYDLTLGQDSVIEGISIARNNTGYLTSTEPNVVYKNLHITLSVATAKTIYATGDHTRISDIHFDSATSNINNQIWIEGDSSRAEGITADLVSVTSGQSFILAITGSYLSVVNCNIDASTYSAGAEGIRLQGDYGLVNGNNVAGIVYPIRANGSYGTITGNTCSPNQNGAGIYVTDTYNTVTGNTVKANTNNIKGIQCTASGDYTTITGNTIIGQATTGSGHNAIQLDSGASECVVSGNIIRTWAFGINVNSSCNDTTIVGNIVSNIGTTAINDNGTGTFYLTATDSDPLNNVV